MFPPSYYRAVTKSIFTQAVDSESLRSEAQQTLKNKQTLVPSFGLEYISIRPPASEKQSRAWLNPSPDPLILPLEKP